jgi:hypothetical protein
MLPPVPVVLEKMLPFAVHDLPVIEADVLPTIQVAKFGLVVKREYP